MSPRTSDPLWLRARSADPIDKARLAESVGALGLIEGVEDGGETAVVALEALAFAEDGDLALRRLGELAASAPPANLPGLLGAIRAIAGRPRTQRELLDPDGVRACGEAMLKLAARRELPPEDRALAVSAARALSEKGYVDSARIPTDLDPK